MPDGHRTAELRSIAFHRAVADRLDEQLLEAARRRVERWLERGGPVPPQSAVRWRALLQEPLPTLARLLTEDTEEMRDLRQNTPFAGALPSPERWRVRSEVP